MRVVIQRVSSGSVEVDGAIKGEIGMGLVVLVGIENEDSLEDADWLARKICNLRVFADKEGVMNLSVKEVSGELLLVSQFTLHASTKKGNRPSYIRAAGPEHAVPLYNEFIDLLQKELGKEIQTGEFGAMMNVDLVNEGPVTITIDTKNKE